MYNQTTTWIPLLRTFSSTSKLFSATCPAVLIFPILLVDFQKLVYGMGTYSYLIPPPPPCVFSVHPAIIYIICWAAVQYIYIQRFRVFLLIIMFSPFFMTSEYLLYISLNLSMILFVLRYIWMLSSLFDLYLPNLPLKMSENCLLSATFIV